MTVMEFEGRTEREAVARAASELGSESFDVEVLEKAGGLFGRGRVKIRVRPLTAIPDPMKPAQQGKQGRSRPQRQRSRSSERQPKSHPERQAQFEPQPQDPESEFERQPRHLHSEPDASAEASVNITPQVPVDPPPAEVVEAVSSFLSGMTERMGIPGTAAYKEMEGSKALFEITSDSSSLLIGKKGKNLDALQLLANTYLNRVAGDDTPWRVVLDSEGYRARREDSLTRMAQRTADLAVKTGSSRLLEPMNPFERRLVHKAVNDRADVVTKSEGEGLYKRVRIIARGSTNRRPRARR